MKNYRMCIELQQSIYFCVYFKLHNSGQHPDCTSFKFPGFQMHVNGSNNFLQEIKG